MLCTILIAVHTYALRRVGSTCASNANLPTISPTPFQDSKAWLKKLTFKEFVVKGKPLANELIKSLLDLHIGDSNMTDSITARLREMAPTLFSEDDATISKGEG